jgi:hypothetical protein
MKKIKHLNNRIIFYHYKKFNWLFLIILIIPVVLISCQKVISLELNTVSPVIVISGNVTDKSGPYYVQITKTVNFDQPNVFPKISGATVKISDNFGNIDTLSETSSGSGIYSTSVLQGIPGRTYTLTVEVDSVTYTAVSSMPFPVNIDTMRIIDVNDFRRKRKELEVTFNDPAGITNYYRFEETVNNYKSNNYSLMNDRYNDGKTIVRDINVNDSTDLKTGDLIILELQSIDKATYDYFRTLRFASGSSGLGFTSASPANPISNFDNGALGYFSAYSMKSKTVVVP